MYHISIKYLQYCRLRSLRNSSELHTHILQDNTILKGIKQ